MASVSVPRHCSEQCRATLHCTLPACGVQTNVITPKCTVNPVPTFNCNDVCDALLECSPTDEDRIVFPASPFLIASFRSEKGRLAGGGVVFSANACQHLQCPNAALYSCVNDSQETNSLTVCQRRTHLTLEASTAGKLSPDLVFATVTTHNDRRSEDGTSQHVTHFCKLCPHNTRVPNTLIKNGNVIPEISSLRSYNYSKESKINSRTSSPSSLIIKRKKRRRHPNRCPEILAIKEQKSDLDCAGDPLVEGLVSASSNSSFSGKDCEGKRKYLKSHLHSGNLFKSGGEKGRIVVQVMEETCDGSMRSQENSSKTNDEAMNRNSAIKDNRRSEKRVLKPDQSSMGNVQRVHDKRNWIKKTSTLWNWNSAFLFPQMNKMVKCILFMSVFVLCCCVGHSEGQVVPCPFNMMCKCRYDPPSDDEPRSRIPTPLEVICVGVPFAKIPKLPAGLIDQVDVVNAGLELLGAEDFDLTRVRNLRLMSNNIRRIGSKTLSEMGHTLLTLDLSFNQLVDIPREAMRHLAALEWLNLQGNQIAEVKRDDWNGLRDTLTSLFLGENNIDKVSPHVLTDFRKLLWVNLDDNNLQKLERDSLSRSINTLSLNNNLLTSFPSDTVSEFKDLTWLHLRGNLIDRLPDKGFVFPKTVDRLDLGENFISFIPNNLFNNTLSVRDLHFDFNLLTEIQENAFEGLNPSRLYLSANKIFNISDKAFMGGPEETIAMLDLEKNSLGHVPKALSFLKNLRYLYLPDNEITSIQMHAFKGSCSKLEALSLSGNFLENIPKNSLANCSMINHLNLGHNRIEQISPEDFESWGDSLETLVLRNNRLSSIPANAFRYTPRMRELSLSFNRIVDVNPDSFIDILGSLEILEISFGFYRDDFPEDVFKPLTSLQWIALDNNNFRTISETALYSFGELSYFNMDSNRLTVIPKTLFHQNVHKKLIDIRMANNFLDELNVHTFHNLEALRTLVLTGNKIKKIYFEAFKSLPLLNTIALSNNEIAEIENQAFSGLTSLTELELQENYLKTFSLNTFANFSITQSPLSLNLSHNEIIELHSGSVGVYSMRSLDINHNHLKQVPINFLQVLSQSLLRLDIGYNRITKLDTSAFGPLEKLQLLILEHNNIQQIRPGAFNHLGHVQLLDLSHNHLQALPHMCFSDMLSLRKVDFSHNHLRALPPSVFTGTSIETLNFAYNEFVSMPTAALSIVESTLHYLDISQNHLEHLDSTMFNSFSNLIELNLASNKLTILPDNVFVSLRNLVSLDISENTVRANFKELFHYTQNIQKLNLAKIGFTSSPTIPLPNLVSLNMSYNGISDIEVHSVVSLRQLRTLDLSHNQITHVHSRIWPYLPYLQQLDLSDNPIQSLTKDSFIGASRIEILVLKNLDEIMRFDYDTLSHMSFIRELYMNTFPNIEKYRFRVGQLLATAHTLRTLHLEVREEALTDQLSGAFGPKLQELHISGKNLKAVDSKTFRGFQNKHELLLSITDTSIESLPDGLLTHLSDVAYLSLDLRRNKLKFLNSHVLYGNKSDWESKGTTFVAGGLALQGNDWTCDCSLVWLGRWLRRWLRETLQIHTAVLKKAQQVDQLAREAVCFEPTTGQYVALLDLRSEDLSCHASALSDTAHTSGTAASAPILPALLFLTAAHAFFMAGLPRRLGLPAALACALVLSARLAMEWGELHGRGTDVGETIGGGMERDASGDERGKFEKGDETGAGMCRADGLTKLSPESALATPGQVAGIFPKPIKTRCDNMILESHGHHQQGLQSQTSHICFLTYDEQTCRCVQQDSCKDLNQKRANFNDCKIILSSEHNEVPAVLPSHAAGTRKSQKAIRVEPPEDVLWRATYFLSTLSLAALLGPWIARSSR